MTCTRRGVETVHLVDVQTAFAVAKPFIVAETLRSAWVDCCGVAGGHEEPEGGGGFRTVRDWIQELKLPLAGKRGCTGAVDETGEI